MISSAIKNVIGRPAKGVCFFNRAQELADLKQLAEKDDVLLLAPRRVGKTSLLLRLCDLRTPQEGVAIYASVASALSEREFVEHLLQEVAQSASGAIERLSHSAAGKLVKRVHKASLAGIATVELSPEADANWRDLGTQLVLELAREKGRGLVAVDELAVFVLNLMRADASGQRARNFLTWFAEVRTRVEGVHWLVAGSIGLGTVARRIQASASLKLRRYDGVGAFERADAEELLEQLAVAYNVSFDREGIERACARIGWLIPHHLQILFSEVDRLRRSTPIRAADVDEAYEAMLGVANRGYFDHWRERLSLELAPAEASRARAILDVIAAAAPEGFTREELRVQLVGSHDEGEVFDEQFRFVIEVLMHDGYLVQEHTRPGTESNRLRFRSPLLRDYWRRYGR